MKLFNVYKEQLDYQFLFIETIVSITNRYVVAESRDSAVDIATGYGLDD
jgi:hypothetical protein